MNHKSIFQTYLPPKTPQLFANPSSQSPPHPPIAALLSYGHHPPRPLFAAPNDGRQRCAPQGPSRSLAGVRSIQSNDPTVFSNKIWECFSHMCWFLIICLVWMIMRLKRMENCLMLVCVEVLSFGFGWWGVWENGLRGTSCNMEDLGSIPHLFCHISSIIFAMPLWLASNN